MSHADLHTHSITLSGLDGQNPLAFLAALGGLRVLTGAWSERSVALSWTSRGGVWIPDLHSNQEMSEEDLVDQLARTLESDPSKHPMAFMNKTGEGKKTKKAKNRQKSLLDAGNEGSSNNKINVPPETAQLFRSRAQIADRTDRDALDWLSAMASDLGPEATSQLQTARRDYFWGNLESVMRLTTADHLRRTLLRPWDYADPLDNQSLHIEPSEDRRHAYQWSQPSGDPNRKKRGGMLGANRLAIEAFPLFQSIAVGGKLSTRGFTGIRANDTRWTWPLWGHTASLDVVSSLLGLADLQADSPDLQKLAARGVRAVFRCRRILVGKTPNFTPAQPV